MQSSSKMEELFFTTKTNETGERLFIKEIMKDFLFRQYKMDANSLSYLKRFCGSINEKDKSFIDRIIF
jgi:hypothetical protein